MTRQIVLDTETTGISHQNGHRIIEIGCLELIDRQLTKNRYHVYLNPERKVDEGAFKVHGISTDFLKDKPLFTDIAETFLDFVKGSQLIIHNASFDMGFLEAEFTRLNWPKPFSSYVTVFDTLTYARQKHRGARNNLDALCKRYKIDNSNRSLHGALLDAEILASVYLAMTGGQIDFFAEVEESTIKKQVTKAASPLSSSSPVIYATEAECKAHEAFVEFLVKHSKVNRWLDKEGQHD